MDDFWRVAWDSGKVTRETLAAMDQVTPATPPAPAQLARICQSRAPSVCKPQRKAGKIVLWYYIMPVHSSSGSRAQWTRTHYRVAD